MKQLILIGITLLVAACAGKKTQTSTEAREQLDEKWSAQVGSATKSDFVQQFGNAQWCQKDAVGDETCRFYLKKATVWVGSDKRDKKNYESFDEVVATFDTKGVLKEYKANAQR